MPKRKQEDAAQTSVTPELKPQFPIVGIGASAGGLEAFVDLLRALPADPGMGLVLIQHQDPKHDSFLSQILGRATTMPVSQVTEDTEVESNHVYVAPPNAQLVMDGGMLRLTPRPTGASMPIDRFFETLAAAQGSRSIVVILSGSASDGTIGLKAIKAGGGVTFAQDESAKFESMPRSAIAGGAVDFILPPHGIADELVKISDEREAVSKDRLPGAELIKIFSMLLKQFHVDFAQYKPTTIERRIRKRMGLHKSATLGDYLRILRAVPDELELLYGDLLIHVTGFFRDPAAFDALKKDVLPKLIEERGDDPLRIWVPGCSTGEEVYSLAIAVIEADGERQSVQFFGTDVSEAAISVARAGIYPKSIESEVSEARLKRFFTRQSSGGYRVSKAIRDFCIFARQNLTRDPPFSKLDLISCRNVMIYLGAFVQKKVMGTLHYALRPGGYLLLGTSETIGTLGEHFEIVDRRNKIYRKKPGADHRPAVEFEAPAEQVKTERPTTAEDQFPVPFNLAREADRVLLSRYAPASVLINEDMEIVHFRGRTSAFLEPAPGEASFSIMKMAREGLLAELRSAIQKAKKTNESVRRQGIRIRKDGTTIVVNIEVLPFLSTNKEKYQLVVFEEVQPAKGKSKRGQRRVVEQEDPRQLARLKRELDATREYLQSIIEEQEAMNEELRSANEEIQSSNEELQSTNEELETAKEELQAGNEELTTLNEESENRNSELAEANNDLMNLLSTVEIPIVMVDGRLRIRRFNPGAQRLLKLIEADVGRPIADLKTTLKIDGLEKMISTVMETLQNREMQVEDQSGGWHSLRIRPYKTADNKIDGAVLIVVDRPKDQVSS